jgi:hypothetical protein
MLGRPNSIFGEPFFYFHIQFLRALLLRIPNTQIIPFISKKGQNVAPKIFPLPFVFNESKAMEKESQKCVGGFTNSFDPFFNFLVEFPTIQSAFSFSTEISSTKGTHYSPLQNAAEKHFTKKSLLVWKE